MTLDFDQGLCEFELTDGQVRSDAIPPGFFGDADPPTARAGGRRDQLLALVVDQPGITLAQAAKFGLKDATGLYAAARRLQDDGLVRKSGAALHPTA